jgi:ribosomal-protein-alanine N-acetyltransferase
MVEADLGQVLAIERDSFATPWSRDSFSHEIRNPIALNLVASRGGDVLGYLCAWVVAGEIKINNIAVRSEQRGRGFGALLLERALAIARARGCAEASLEVRPSNREARRLYRRFGFRVEGRRKGYYQDSGEDALLMVKDLLAVGE